MPSIAALVPLAVALTASASPLIIGRNNGQTFKAPSGFNVTYQSSYNACVLLSANSAVQLSKQVFASDRDLCYGRNDRRLVRQQY